MDLSIFDVLGPVMVGPSSSHTAGALKLARTASLIAAKPFYRVRFGLFGSFSKTGRGHGTDKALLAGAMGLCETDERIKRAFELADERGIEYEFCEAELADSHENSCAITFFHNDNTQTAIVGSSIGGGQILITDIDGVKTEISANQPTILVRQYDRKGVISAITSILAEAGINIGVMRLSREFKGDIATTVIETDDALDDSLRRKLMKLDNVISVRFIIV
ncbi:MAG: L-serine ammonia-lyase, iron-sulfur-dependent subunit beta [Oscillospiraceae bacterium]